MILFSVNAYAGTLGGRLKLLRERVGDEHMLLGLTDDKLGGWGTADAYRKIIDNEIGGILAARNGALAPGSKLRYEQLFNFQYEDGVKMVTVGGLLYDETPEGYRSLGNTRRGFEKIRPNLQIFSSLRRCGNLARVSTFRRRKSVK